MDGQENLLDYETIKAAVAGEKWATEKCWPIMQTTSTSFPRWRSGSRAAK